MDISTLLKEIRVAEGFSTAKAFFKHMDSSRELSFNYAYYTRIESGSAFPSSKVINEVGFFLTKENAQGLIHQYCSCLFPAYKNTFTNEVIGTNHVDASENESQKMSTLQNVLTLKQVMTISKSIDHYLVFLLTTLARRALKKSEFEVYVSKNLDEVIKSLVRDKVLIIDNDKIKQSSEEQRFPPVGSDKVLMKVYQQLDDWDKQLNKKLKLINKRKKTFIKRTSKRHLDLILSFLENTDNLIRISDEMDESTYNEVFIFQYDIFLGKVPG